jgi:hypothetical protein
MSKKSRLSRESLSYRSYAKHRAALGLPGRTLAAVQRALESGRIVADHDGRIDPIVADRAWLENTIPRDDNPATKATRGTPDNLASAPVAALDDLRELLAKVHVPLFKLTGREVDFKVIVTEWARLPKLLRRLEDGMHAAGVPLYAKDMP